MHALQKKRYTVDLAAQMAECEANYARIMRLLPDLDSVDQRAFGVAMPGSAPAQLRITVTERCKYTTMVDVTQSPLSGVSRAIGQLAASPSFSLRIYHDARMAEVVAFDRHRQIRARYEYPNQNMYHEDEKAQLNRFLGEWLSHCLRYGHALEDPAAPVFSRA